MFDSLEDVIRTAAAAVRPPERLTVDRAAEKYRKLGDRSALPGPFRNSVTPYFVEPQQLLTSLEFETIVIVAPSQCGKTDIALNWITHTVKSDPADMMIVEVTQQRAQEFSELRLDRLHRDSPSVAEEIMLGQRADTVYRKRYVNGTIVMVSWPTISTLSGKPIQRLFMTDYDRMPANIGGEGVPYRLASQRRTSYGMNSMVVVESSPSEPITDALWTPASPHEAPPCEKIMSLYNHGDRRRWYWLCVKCDNAFEPDFSLLRWTDGSDEFGPYSLSVWMECPFCQAKYYESPHGDMPGKAALNATGFWLRDFQHWVPGEGVVGNPHKSKIASLWLKGPAAVFKPWDTLVQNTLGCRVGVRQDRFGRSAEDYLQH